MDKKVIDSLLELIIKNIVTVFKEGKAVEKFIIVTFSKVRQWRSHGRQIYKEAWNILLLQKNTSLQRKFANISVSTC